MGYRMLAGIVIVAASLTAKAQVEETAPDNRTVIGGTNPLLAAGATEIGAGNYDEGIRLTLEGLRDRSVLARDRAAALSNVCAAYAAKGLADAAIRTCTESLAVASNWNAYSNRSYAYWLKGLYSEATFDLDAAAAINPKARQIAQIRGMINVARLEPNITMEDLQ